MPAKPVIFLEWNAYNSIEYSLQAIQELSQTMTKLNAHVHLALPFQVLQKAHLLSLPGITLGARSFFLDYPFTAPAAPNLLKWGAQFALIRSADFSLPLKLASELAISPILFLKEPLIEGSAALKILKGLPKKHLKGLTLILPAPSPIELQNPLPLEQLQQMQQEGLQSLELIGAPRSGLKCLTSLPLYLNNLKEILSADSLTGGVFLTPPQINSLSFLLKSPSKTD
ncbi:MAG: hypothetical protein K0S07_1530 [Chlamydiales bacterium]|jgi:hypothetical protein|nr:hypothetical protein [Chlamydiales bacterium]